MRINIAAEEIAITSNGKESWSKIEDMVKQITEYDDYFVEACGDEEEGYISIRFPSEIYTIADVKKIIKEIKAA